MHHFFVAPSDVEQDRVFIKGSDARHIAKVLRLIKGDKITVSDGAKNLYKVELANVALNVVECRIIESISIETQPYFKLTLMQCLPKSSKMELVIQKGTELGVSCFVPLMCKRTIVKLDEKSIKTKLRRWKKIAYEAAKQSRRLTVPEVLEPISLREAIEKIDEKALILMPWEGEQAVLLKDVLSEYEKLNRAYVIIGPEGGFETEEVELAKKHNAKIVSLGKRIMRAETAGLYVASVLVYLFGE
ncbi:16S rRNA (uracil(1498)-N(3))-methyltransferase [Peptococcaceae bacterium]|nr:16S rRNA (uracil(1498)-N(3))-methyltransferase [Peptococcaceae bacterium]MCL0043568.1 16S rRNA (uracil(1498)-N(3))-methyltransferase [Peptococcaceae bacterium]